MYKKLLLFIVALAGLNGLYAQQVDLSIENSANACGLSTDCPSAFACFDIVMNVDVDKDLDAYNIWVKYDNAVLSRVTGGADASCVIGDGGDTDLEGSGAYRVGGVPTAPYPMTANVPETIHTICFSILDSVAYATSFVSVGGDMFAGALRTTVTFNDATFDDMVPDSLLTLMIGNAPCLNPPTNMPPVAGNDSVTLDEDMSITVDVFANDTDPDGSIDSTSVAEVTMPANGSVSYVGDSVVYTPIANFNGVDSFEYVICDDGIPAPVACDTASVFVTVNPINDAPLAMDDVANTTEDTDVIVDVLANDNDDLDPLGAIDSTSIIEVTPPSNGMVTIVQGTSPGTDTVIYTPDPGFFGMDTFTYAVCDDGNPLPALCDTAQVVISVGAVNDPPMIGQPPVTIPEDSMITFCPTVTDPDMGDSLTISLCSMPANGMASADTGCITYTPDPDFNGMDSICVIVCDDGTPVLCDSTIVVITVNPINDAPVAMDDTGNTTENIPVTVDILANDNDDLDPLGNIDTASFAIVDTPTNGTFVCIADTCVYTPNTGFNGNDTLTYSICDDGNPLPALCDTAQVVISVGAVNDPPMIGQPPVTIPEDSMITFCPTVTDPDMGDSLTISLCSMPANGMASADTGCITYTPDPDFNGMDSICVIVCDDGTPVLCDSTIVVITVNPINDAPVAMDDTGNTTENIPVTVDILANDNDDLDPLGNIDTASFAIVDTPTNGTFVCIADTCVYTPNTGFNGNDTLTYSICDDGNPLPALCDTAQVVISVGAVNDPPMIGQPPVTIPEDSMITFCPTVTDPDMGDSLTISLCSMPANGMASADTGCITYTPDPDFNGMDSICVIVCDDGTPVLCDSITVVITVNPINDAPVALDDTATTDQDMDVTIPILANDSDDLDPLGNIDSTTLAGVTPPDSGTVTYGGDTVVYSPNPGFVGMDTFTYVICDDGNPLPMLCDTAEVIVTVLSGENQPPVALEDTTTIDEDMGVTINVLVNDLDPDGMLDPNTLDTVMDPSNGTITINNLTGEITYTPNPNFNGIDTFSYVICDDGMPVLCDTAIVIVTVNPINDAPVATDDAAITLVDTPIDIDVPFNDNDDLDPLGNIDETTVGIVDSASNGDVSIDLLTGVITYTPDAGFTGTDTFTYVICDDGNPLPVLCDTAEVIVSITTNTPPIGLADTVTADIETNIVITVLANDMDPDGDNIITTDISTSPSNGTVSINPDGTITYTPNPCFIGDDFFFYVVCDDGVPSFCDTVLVFLTVEGELIANDDVSSGIQNATQDIDINGNDVIPCDSDTTVVSSTPSDGTAVINPDGTVTYTPNTDFFGLDTFEYVVCIGTLCDTAQVFITVTEPDVEPYFPNAFSPNGDGQNDVFSIDALKDFPEAEMYVHNRWGDEIWGSNGPYMNDWNGTNFKGLNMPDGTYYYVIYFNDADDTAPKTGFVEIRR